MNMENARKNCHIAKGPLCLYNKLENMPVEYFKAYIAYMNMTKGYSFQDNPECVKKMINKVYWKGIEILNDVEDVGESNVVVILCIVAGVFVVAIVLFIMYFRTSGHKENEEEGLTQTSS